MGYIIATVNMKGGVSKTTLSINLATCLAKYHSKRVLLVDLDSQFNATLCMITPSEFTKIKKSNKTLSSLLKQLVENGSITSQAIKSIVQCDVCTVKGLDLIAGDFEISDDFMISKYLCDEFIVNEDYRLFEEVWEKFEARLVCDIKRDMNLLPS